MRRIVYREWRIESSRYWSWLAILAVVIAIGGMAALYMEHHGHWVTGMTNSVVWGTPHIFAVFLIISASGALNVASIGTVFDKAFYKPLGRLSGLLAAALLVGGLLILVLDLGRPDRLVVAMTTYNFSSIFAWNIFLYSGFVAVVIAYLWTMADRKGVPYTKPVGIFAFLWRLALTTGTGSIFGFLVGREAYDTAVLAPMFVVMSFAYGLAIYILVLMYSFEQDDRPVGALMLKRLKNLLGLFVSGVLYFTLIYHLTRLYGAQTQNIEHFILVSGGIYTVMFWLGWIILGSLVPLFFIYHPQHGKNPKAIALASALVIFGGLAAMYVLIIGSQAYPLEMFPGKTVVEFGAPGDIGGVVAPYWPSLPEFLLGIGGVAVALLITSVGIRVLQFLPESLADRVVDPHVALAEGRGR
ncbi:NrfD/PsrC family molybdoenzyme membrane anchor subunit [Rhabdochromatium marinum]|uniref:NrfD/PsrC family molybdoenzyme membrane anchor subunit n=1 Tax=Rhabdochromatium marinum TaxID=48729 RepID=UPI001908B251|nr:NrfD/PsrC family molybdoenzyme membrane anchor subunit [Rhabdochromatium marinum]MBK1648000.1 molybdopterin oxidoreductase [Rhabdochromatium marinum]